MDGLRWTTPDQWHVTVRFFGELGPVELAAATTALRGAAGSLAEPVTARGGPATTSLGPALLVWPVEGLAQAAREVQGATAGIGQAVPDRRYFGHLTVARARRGADLRSARHLFAPLAISWPVTSLTLVQSELGPGGARYRTVESVAMAGHRA
jgi:RNA 2',3'-cyclic 3'-phosphodiesterase